MFYFRIEKTTGKGQSPIRIGGNADQVFESEKTRVLAATGRDVAFISRHEDVIILGESLVPVGESAIKQVYNQLQQNAGMIVINGNIPVFAAINLKSGQARVFRNISCNRTAYFHLDENGFSCSSHLQPLRDEGVRLEIDEDRIPEFLLYRYIIPPLTLFKNIGAIPGGWEIDYGLESGEIRSKNHGSIIGQNFINNLNTAVDTTSELFDRAIGSIKDSGLNAAVLLSGGLDSSILGAVCHKAGIANKSVSSGFQKITGDNGESDYAITAAKAIGMAHVVYDISEEEYLDGFIDGIKAAEEPLHHLQSVVLGVLFSRKLSPEIKYLFNGEGADALFGNDAHIQFWKSRNIIKFTDKEIMKGIVNPLMSKLMRLESGDSYFDYSHSQSHDNPRHWLWSLEAWGDMVWIQDYFGVDFNKVITSRRLCMDSFSSWSLPDKITALCLNGDVDETQKIWGKLGEHGDRIVMYPFTNPDILSFILQVAWNVKAKERKYVLRELARKLGIPDNIIYRPKKSFGFPIHYWALPGALFQPLVDMSGEMFDPAILRSLQTNDQSKAMILWGMLNIYYWRKIFVDNVAPSDLKTEIVDRRSRMKVVA